MGRADRPLAAEVLGGGLGARKSATRHYVVRRVGLILLAVGLAGFLLASGRAARADHSAAAWEESRWLLAGAAVIGAVFTLLPGKKADA